ncbi:hypothetical protein C8Q77DRAFT_1215317 [Trametes polyzona]|nr:hypothetical protein C8Q77DRAFT_1215317 [Trametes polyzona]
MSRASSPSDRTPSTYSASLSRYAAKLSRRRLSDIRLANILAGHTCSPIGLADFEVYLALKEHSLENLHFAVWYQSYRKRYFASSPISLARPHAHHKSDSFHSPISTPGRTAQRMLDLKRQSDIASSRSSPTDSTFSSTMSPSSSRCVSMTPSASIYALSSSHLPMLPYTAPSSPGIPCGERILHKSLIMRSLGAECARVAATFLTPGAPKELMLEADVRDALLRDLTWSINPDIFLSAYESVVEALEVSSLPRFLEHASANINRPKQLFWYSIGVFDMLLAVILVTLLVVFLPSWLTEASRRAWRLSAVPLFSLGSMQAYSAWRGFCSKVWSRGNTQLRVWELEGSGREMETAPLWSSANVISRNAVSVAQESRVALPTVPEEGRASASSDEPSPGCATYDGLETPDLDLSFILDGTYDSKCGNPASSPYDAYPSLKSPTSMVDLWGWESPSLKGPSNTQDQWGDASKSSRKARRASARLEYRRPPVFGPERPVLDPRIREVHRAVLRDMLAAGFVCTAIFTAIVLAVPSVQGS